MLIGYATLGGQEVWNNVRTLDYLFGDPDRGVPGMAALTTTVNRRAMNRSILPLVCDPPLRRSTASFLYAAGGKTTFVGTTTTLAYGASIATAVDGAPGEFLEQAHIGGGVIRRYYYNEDDTAQARPLLPAIDGPGWLTLPAPNPQQGRYDFGLDSPYPIFGTKTVWDQVKDVDRRPYFEQWTIGPVGLVGPGLPVLFYVDPGVLGDIDASLDGGTTWSKGATQATPQPLNLEVQADRYTSPEEDDAPWWDDSVPESGDFAGLFVEEVTGFDSTLTRDVAEGALGGSSLGLRRRKGRQLIVTGWLRSSTCGGAEFGLSWLTEALSGGDGCDEDGLSDLYMLRSAPGAETDPDPLRYGRLVHRIAVTDGPVVLDRAGTCCGDCNATNLKVQFTLQSETPYIFSEAQWAAYQAPFDQGPFDLDLSLPCRDNCTEGPEPWEPECAAPLVAPPDPGYSMESCYCEPWETMRSCFSFHNPHQWNDAVAYIEITSGNLGLRNVKLLAWRNDVAEQTCPCDWEHDPAWACTAPCASFTIGEMPRNSTLIIDSRTRHVELVQPGGRRVPGMQFVGGAEEGQPFSWFDIGHCASLCMVASVSAHTAFGSSITFGVVNRYLASGT